MGSYKTHALGSKEIKAYLRWMSLLDLPYHVSPTYFPFVLHFSPCSSSFFATVSDTPTATSALFVRKDKIGNAPRRGPGENEPYSILLT
jgi:hypothetical protein